MNEQDSMTHPIERASVGQADLDAAKRILGDSMWDGIPERSRRSLTLVRELAAHRQQARDAGFAEGQADFLRHLREVNTERLAAWEGDDQKTDGIFHATELGGEVGEVLNVVKKLHREAMGWRGSRATIADLSDEIGDVLICLDKLAAHYGLDLAAATAAKFNATSDKVGLPHKLSAEANEGRCDG